MMTPNPHLLPRRPARTSQTEEEQYVVFARTPRQKDIIRMVEGLRYPGRTPIVRIRDLRDGVQLGRILIHADNVPMIIDACGAARTASHVGRFDAGVMNPDGNVRIFVWAPPVDPRGPCVCFGRIDRSNTFIGGPVVVSDQSLDALEQALGWLSSVSSLPVRSLLNENP